MFSNNISKLGLSKLNGIVLSMSLRSSLNKFEGREEVSNMLVKKIKNLWSNQHCSLFSFLLVKINYYAQVLQICASPLRRSLGLRMNKAGSHYNNLFWRLKDPEKAP